MTEPTGAENLPLKHVRETLVTIAEFLTFTGLDEAGSRGKIKYHQYPIARSDRPMCIVGHGDEAERDGDVQGQGAQVVEDSVRLLIEDNADTADADSEKLVKFHNAACSFMDKFVAAARDYGFRCRGLRRVLRPMIDYDGTEAEEDPFCFVVYEIAFTDVL